MANRLTKRALTTYTPAIQAVVGQPAYCVTRTERVPYYVRGRVAIPAVNTGTQFSTYEVYYRDVPTLTCYPAILAVTGREARTETDNQLGWNAGGRSQAQLAGDGVITFAFPGTPAGVIAGLGPITATSGDFSGIEHGIYTDGARLFAFESGVQVYQFAAAASSRPALSVLRAGSAVTYQVGTERYASARESQGSKVLLAALFAAGDSVDNPVVVNGLGISGSSSWDWAGAPAGRLSGRSSWTWAGAGAVRDSSQVSAPPTPEAIAGEALMPFSVGGLMLDVEPMDAGLALPLLLLASDHDYLAGTSSLSMEPLSYEGESYTTGVPPTSQSVDLIESLGLVARNQDIPLFYATLSESLAVGDSLTLLVSLSAELFEGLLARDRLTLSAIIQASLDSGLALSDQAALARAEALQYAVNLATGGATRYQGFDFLGFARAGLDTYAIRPDGLYRLGADAGPLDALIDFAAEDFGSSSQKYLDALYLGLTSDGEVLARIGDDRGNTYTYRVQGEAPSLRVPVGRGLHSRLFELRLTLEAAHDIQLETVEWAAAASTRRLTRGQR